MCIHDIFRKCAPKKFYKIVHLPIWCSETLIPFISTGLLRYNEVKLYDFSASHKRNFDPQPVNEFIQLVYEGQTREVGVAFSLSRTNKQYVVARYYKKRNNMMLDSEVHPAHSGKKFLFCILL